MPRLRPADHPRACGELPCSFGTPWLDHGSSPRMRGTLDYQAQGYIRVRIIPAHAGNSLSESRQPRPPPDHPRACGELMPKARLGSWISGSSPRMRGTRAGRQPSWPRCRIIPAHAGNSMRVVEAIPPLPDHPRACGELRKPSAPKSGASGSSPRMRGTLGCGGVCCGSHRIIPAHAGNSAAPGRPRLPQPDHPRACGELLRAEVCRVGSFGSSPRMRGTLQELDHRGRPNRIIPAHAGNSITHSCQISCQSDHPRACGELNAALSRVFAFAGSSPRMRGTLDTGRLMCPPTRIIPAHAGNSSARVR